MPKAKAKDAQNENEKPAGTAVKQLRDWSKPLASPLRQYPGTVSLPQHFTLADYRRWSKANEKLLKIESDELELAMTGSYSANGSGPRFDSFDPRQWAHVLAVCSFDLENLPPKATTDDSGESTPFEVMAWLIPIVLNEYIPEKLNLKN